MALKNTTDLTKGSVFKRLLLFTLPLLATNLLQQFYSAADIAVVGSFAENGKDSLAAVGATSYITNFLLNLFIGIAIGANVVCANLYGAKKQASLYRCMHTAMILALVCGIGIALVGVLLAPWLLRLTNCDPLILDKAALYMRLYFLGAPASIVYNFGAGILRAHGDTKRPMIILSSAGIVNVALNLVFVILFHWDVAGVAVATVISQVVSAIAVVVVLLRPTDVYKLKLSGMRFYADELKMIVRFGVPCGLNGMVFSVSNVLLQSTVNSFGSVYMASATAAGSLTSFIYCFINAFYTASVSFAGQNYGAKRYDRIRQVMLYSSTISSLMILAASALVTVFCPFFLGLYADDAQVIQIARTPLMIMIWTYPIYAVAESAIGCLRGMGQSTLPTLLNAFCICVPRFLWVLFIFPMCPHFWFLYLCYPISWLICAVVQFLYYIHCRRELEKMDTSTANV